MMMQYENLTARHGVGHLQNHPIVASGDDAPETPLVFAAVLFADIKGFTRFCQLVDPQTAFRMLSTFHERMAEVVADHSATLTAATGDEVMAAWCGTPSRVAAKALRCGYAMLETVSEFNQNEAFLAFDLKIGVGIHAGSVILGRIPGSANLSVYGDTVNIASRLEQMTRGYDTDLIVSEELLQKAALLPQAIETERLRTAITTTLRDRKGSIKIRVAE